MLHLEYANFLEPEVNGNFIRDRPRTSTSTRCELSGFEYAKFLKPPIPITWFEKCDVSVHRWKNYYIARREHWDILIKM